MDDSKDKRLLSIHHRSAGRFEECRQGLIIVICCSNQSGPCHINIPRQTDTLSPHHCRLRTCVGTAALFWCVNAPLRTILYHTPNTHTHPTPVDVSGWEEVKEPGEDLPDVRLRCASLQHRSHFKSHEGSYEIRQKWLISPNASVHLHR